jgi:hypothetical protein
MQKIYTVYDYRCSEAFSTMHKNLITFNGKLNIKLKKHKTLKKVPQQRGNNIFIFLKPAIKKCLLSFKVIA